jgi:hypothetical protein
MNISGTKQANNLKFSQGECYGSYFYSSGTTTIVVKIVTEKKCVECTNSLVN